jgi:hypothetical protein
MLAVLLTDAPEVPGMHERDPCAGAGLPFLGLRLKPPVVKLEPGK